MRYNTMFDFNHYKIGKNKIPQIPTKKNGKGAPPPPAGF